MEPVELGESPRLADDRLTDAIEVGDERLRRGECQGHLVTVQDDAGEFGLEERRVRVLRSRSARQLARHPRSAGADVLLPLRPGQGVPR